MIGYDLQQRLIVFSDSTFSKSSPFILTFSFLSFSGSEARVCHVVFSHIIICKLTLHLVIKQTQIGPYKSTNLKADLAHKKCIENPMCKCDLAHETPLHVLFHSKLYDTQRESLINSIELMYMQKHVPYHLRTIDFDTLVGFNNQHSLEVRYHIAKSISTFLCSITSSI